jgi:hypothetical protein
MPKHWKTLGMSLVALIGLLAVNASAAQAKWLPLVNKTSVNSIKLTGSSEGAYLLSESGSKIHCTKSTGTATATLSGDKTLLGGSATATFTGCTEEAFKTCSIQSLGQAAGTIIVKGEGDFEMEANGSDETVWGKGTGPGGQLAVLVYGNDLCPLNEAEEALLGYAKISVLNALQDLKLHEIHILGESFKLGENKAELHMINEKKELLPLILGSSTEAAGGTFAFHLCNLPGGLTCL